jgi:hypothetical protein
MNTELEESLDVWPEWIQQFELDPTFGYLVDPSYKPTSFNYPALCKILEKLSDLNESKGIIEAVQNMPEIWINKELATHRDMVILHDYCSYLIHSYIKILRDQKVIDYDIVIPKNLAIPLAESAGFLRIKTGMATGIGYNWTFTHKPQDLDTISIQHIAIRYFYSNQKEYESLFFQVSVVTSYFLGRIMKNCY